MSWLVRGDDVLAAAEVAVTRRLRAKGLMGREDLEGVMVLRPCRQVHTFGMRFPIDVAFCDSEGIVLRTVSLVPWRVSPYVHKAAFAIEAHAGAFERWQLRAGDRVELRA